MKRRRITYRISSSKRGKWNRPKVWLIIFLISLLTLITFYFFPTSLHKQLSSACLIECKSYYAIPIAGKDTLRFSPIFNKEKNKLELDFSCHKNYCSGSFISNSGHIITSAAVQEYATDTLSSQKTKENLEQMLAQIEGIKAYTEKQIEEFEYYTRTHFSTDDGYEDVMMLQNEISERAQKLDSLKKIINVAIELRRPAILHKEFTYYHQIVSDSGHIISTSGNALLVHQKDSLLLLQTSEEVTPSQCHHLSYCIIPPEWTTYKDWSLRVLGYPSYFCDSEDIVFHTPMVIPYHLPLPTLCEGAMVCDVFGRPSGIILNGNLCSSKKINHLMHSQHSYLSWKWLSIKTFFKNIFTPKTLNEKTLPVNKTTHQTNILNYFKTDEQGYQALSLTDGTYVGETQENKPNGNGRLTLYNGDTHSGLWTSGKKNGWGEYMLSDGTTYKGVWKEDTLPLGFCIDSTGYYNGSFNDSLQRQGYGDYEYFTGEHYQGEWEKDAPHGFGINVSAHKIIECGTWKNGKFRGEKMKYTSDRVYGIDISRYQHESRGNSYGINWEDLHIKNLGATAQKSVVGKANYPISFIYIKATEGKSITNKYYESDIAQARKKKIAVGAYHFFSTTVKGKEQADHFIQQAKLQKGDLPPVLDIEPSDRQINEMGGAKAMFAEIKIWLEMVEKHCGRKPLLYVSQHFINQYLQDAPDFIKEHDVWVARYGVFRPYVHLQYWQLSCDGKVNGIMGDIDINVFNGTKEQFNDYKKEVAIKKIND